MSKGCNLISLGEIDRYFVLMFIGPILLYILKCLENSSKFFNDKNKENRHPIILKIIYSFGLSLSFVLFIFFKIYNKRKNKNQLTLMIPVKNQTIQITNKIEKFLWLLLVSAIDFIANIINIIIDAETYLFITWTSVILSLVLFSYLIFRAKIYKHHYFSIIIMIVLSLAADLASNKYSAEKIKEDYLQMILIIFSEMLLSLAYVLYKYMMVKKYIQSYEIMFYEGLIESVLSIITIIITTNNGYLDDFYDYYNNLDSKEITIFIFLIIFQFAYNLVKFIVIQRYTQYHHLLLSTLYMLVTLLIGFDSDKILFSIVSLILIIICLTMILIFLEIIELNCFGLSNMTKNNIRKRAILDSELAGNEGSISLRIDFQDYVFDMNGRKSSEMIEMDSKLCNDDD